MAPLLHILSCQIRLFLFPQALLSRQRLSLLDLLVSLMYLVALTVDIRQFSHIMALVGPESPGLAPLLRPFPTKFESSCFHKHCSFAQRCRTVRLFVSRMYSVALTVSCCHKHCFLALRIWLGHAHRSSLPHQEFQLLEVWIPFAHTSTLDTAVLDGVLAV